MTEDELYRTSTQYRLWSFTPEKLASLRTNTNAVAAEHVRAAIKRKREAHSQLPSRDVSATPSAATSDVENNGVSNGAGGPVKIPKIDKEIECLTAEEEKKLIDYYCSNCLQMGLEAPLKLPIYVMATAIQFLKRFYLSNSPMTYHPRKIMSSALFLATKTETIHFPLKEFVERMKTVKGLEKITEEEVLAPEFIITQGLRFAFDVRHPFRALKGAYLELLSLVNVVKGGKSPTWISTSSENLAGQLLDLPKPGPTTDMRFGPHGQRASPLAFEKRVKSAYDSAKERLEFDVLISDAYFFYTPSQIVFATLWLADPPFIEFYLSLKMSTGTPFQDNPKKQKIMTVIKDCGQLLLEHASQSDALFEEVRQIEKKLHHCRNPEKADLVRLNQSQKRDAAEGGSLGENVAKKRKLEREQNAREAEELFGPDIRESNRKT